MIDKHLIYCNTTVIEALDKLNMLADSAVLFYLDEQGNLKGSLTDGDIRRGLLNHLTLTDNINLFINISPNFLRLGTFDIHQLLKLKLENILIIPILEEESDKIIDIFNFNKQKSLLPIDVVVMAGGRGERLRPLTDNTPKPLLNVGDKPIIRYGLDRLLDFGVIRFHFSLRYLGNLIKDYLETDFRKENIFLDFTFEDKPLGTIGAIKQFKHLKNNTILLTNSDLLTNINYEDFYLKFIDSNADMAIATISSEINIPYGVLECNENVVTSFVEKPTYTYFTNGGIYLFKKELIELIPEDNFFNATDLIDLLIKNKRKIISYPIHNYWLDVGRHEDFQKAQEDVKNINF